MGKLIGLVSGYPHYKNKGYNQVNNTGKTGGTLEQDEAIINVPLNIFSKEREREKTSPLSVSVL